MSKNNKNKKTVEREARQLSKSHLSGIHTENKRQKKTVCLLITRHNSEQHFIPDDLFSELYVSICLGSIMLHLLHIHNIILEPAKCRSLCATRHIYVTKTIMPQKPLFFSIYTIKSTIKLITIVTTNNFIIFSAFFLMASLIFFIHLKKNITSFFKSKFLVKLLDCRYWTFITLKIWGFQLAHWLTALRNFRVQIITDNLDQSDSGSQNSLLSRYMKHWINEPVLGSIDTSFRSQSCCQNKFLFEQQYFWQLSMILQIGFDIKFAFFWPSMTSQSIYSSI